MNLKEISTKELEAEIERREKAKEDQPPKPLAKTDFSPLLKICQDYINDCQKDELPNEDYDHYIFEAAMECIYGKDVWTWINEHLD